MSAGSSIARGPLLVCLAAALWGTVGVASKVLYGIEDVPPLVVGFFRLALAVPLLALWCFSRLGRETLRFEGRDLALILTLGVAMALYQVCYFQAVADVGVALATLITICSAPILVAAMAALLLGERITKAVALALGLGLIGAALLVGTPTEAAAPAGVAWAAGAAATYATFVLCARCLAGHDPGKIIVVGFGTGALLLMPFAITAGIQPAGWHGSVWLALFYVGLVPTGLAYLLYFRGMRDTAATPASLIALVEPLTATTLAVMLFDERLGIPAMLGGGLLMIATVLLLRRGPAQAPGRVPD